MINKSLFTSRHRGIRFMVMLMTTVTLTALPPSWTHAQGQCATALTNAEQMYAAGRFTAVIQILNRCLPDDIPEEQRLRAYRLLALAYLAEDYSDRAENAIEELLELAPGYQPDLAHESEEFVALINRVKIRSTVPLLKLIRINFGYPLLLLNGHYKSLSTGNLTAGIEILFGKKKFAGGLSYDYFRLRDENTSTYIDPYGPEPVFTDIGKFYSLVFMYRPDPTLQDQKILPYGLLKLGSAGFDSQGEVAYSFSTGVNIPIKHSRHSYFNLNYKLSNFPFNHALTVSFNYFFTGANIDSEDSRGKLHMTKVQLNANWGSIIYF